MSDRIENWEIGAFVDGELPPQRRREIEDAARRSESLRAVIDDYVRQNRLVGQLWEPSETIDEIPPRQAHLARRLAAAIRSSRGRARMWEQTVQRLGHGWMVLVGGAIGWAAASFAAIPAIAPGADPLPFVDEASEAHRVITMAPMFASDARTVNFNQLSQMFSDRITAPDLSGLGIELQRVDVVATDNGPAIVLLYQDADTHPISLMLSANGQSLKAMAGVEGVDVITYSDLAIAYGRNEGLAYAVMAQLPERRVYEIARHMFADRRS